jgi:hypothetical protein
MYLASSTANQRKYYHLNEPIELRIIGKALKLGIKNPEVQESIFTLPPTTVRMPAAVFELMHNGWDTIYDRHYDAYTGKFRDVPLVPGVMAVAMTATAWLTPSADMPKDWFVYNEDRELASNMVETYHTLRDGLVQTAVWWNAKRPK